MHSPLPYRRQARRGLGPVLLSGLLAGLMLFCSLAGASGWMHGLLHDDHQAPQHHCLLAVFQSGHIAPASAAPPGLPELTSLLIGVSLPQLVPPRQDGALLFGRGPPLSL